ncbi:hypothetical protein RTO_18320 [[Ruminococcus] torques L2-14]|uniref:Uncharacterized protein n=1 Tax=[Ruminococcus] torques L2-14 TaxID=657313 RepID=D4M582_9FIRM|nr:hypothetical protein [[Ruminococcus] torques]CBL26394.1 hypothetical protein RTO_18320 [[Ruminococcus] torques L2-14]
MELAQYQNYEEYKKAMNTVLNRTVEDFVMTGYLLKQGRDTDILKDSGYSNVNEFAWAEYKLEATQVSRYIRINDRFSEGGYSPRLQDHYKGFGYAKLALMLTLPESVAEELTPAYSKSEIQAVKEEIESEEKITDIEVILEGEKKEQRDLNNLEKAINQICMEDPELYVKLHGTVRTSVGTEPIKDVLAPDGDKLYSVRPQGCGRIMLYLNDEKDEVILQVVRQSLKERYAWSDILGYLVLITEQEDAKKNWEDLFGQQYPEKEQIAPVQPKKEKRKESKVVKAKPPKAQKQEKEKPVELPSDIPGQTEIEKDFPEMLPEPVKTSEIQREEPNCTGATVEIAESVENSVNNSKTVEENAINTETGTESEEVDNSKQNPAGSRWEYMKTMESYKMALYMAASVNEMPHMMLNSAEYWKKWLEAEVDENGDEFSKK